MPNKFFRFFFSIFLTIVGSEGLRDVRLEGQRYIRYGEDFMLRCSYDLESESLYAVKWYRGVDEFYRFIPRELRPKQKFSVRGVYVDYFQSDDHHVHIRNATFETNGRYKCVVSSDGSFQTLSDHLDITVVVVGYDSPRLSLDKVHYLSGDTGTANCTTVGRTFPPVNITWFINNKVVNERIITRVVRQTENPRLSYTVSTLIFQVRDEEMAIKCRGQLFDLYAEASVIRVHPLLGNTKRNQANSLQVSAAQGLIFVASPATLWTVVAIVIYQIVEVRRGTQNPI